MRRAALPFASVLVPLTLLTACAAGSSPAQPSPTSSAASQPSLVRRHPSPVVLILMENHSYSQIAGRPSAPYLNAFAHNGALYTNMQAIRHPSLPNYLALTSGSTLGCTNDACPPTSFGAKNIFSQLRKHGQAWRAWAESMPSPCLRHNASPYAVRHNPPPYYRNLVPGDCRRHDLPYPNRLPRRIPGLTFITPNICNDMHDCSVSVGDSWLRRHVPPLLHRGAIVVITFDEGEGDNHIFCAARGPGVGHGVRHRAAFTHYSLLAGIERHFGLARLRNAAHVRPVPL